jgi:hypothetical protein
MSSQSGNIFKSCGGENLDDIITDCSKEMATVTECTLQTQKMK